MININNVNYEIIKVLYDNKSSKLFKCKHLNKFYVIKCYKKKYFNRWENEINILKSIANHPNIVGIINYSSNVIINNILYHPLVINFYKYGDLFDFMCDNIGLLNKKLIVNIFNQILSGVLHLTKCGWVHRDLKLENILVTNIDPIQIKIIDFEYTTESIYSKRQVGTITYMSPQTFLKKNYNTKKNDIWALGVLLFILYTGKRPYSSEFANSEYTCEWLTAIKEKNWKLFWESIEGSCKGQLNITLIDENNKFNSNFKDLIQKMLCWDENKRANLYHVISHSFLNYNDVINSNNVINNNKVIRCTKCILF